MLAVSAACDGSPTTAGVTQCAAVSTQSFVISVPVHRPPPTSIATTVGYSPTVVGVPPRIGAGPVPARATLTRNRWMNTNHNAGRRNMARSIAASQPIRIRSRLTPLGRLATRFAHCRPHPSPRFSPSFSIEANLLDDHAAIDGLAHVVNGQRGGRYGGQCLHFDAGPVERPHRGGDLHDISCHPQPHV